MPLSAVPFLPTPLPPDVVPAPAPRTLDDNGLLLAEDDVDDVTEGEAL